MRVQDGKTPITNGPFAETKEAIGGYLLFEGIPVARMGGAIEVCPIVEW